MVTYEVTRLAAIRTARSPWRYWVLLTAGVGVASGMVVSPLPILAVQVPVPPLVAQASQDALDSLPATGLPARWATITTDTGDYAPGHRDFARYTTPLWCVQAARTETAYRRRTAAAQAATDTPWQTVLAQDTLPADVVRIAGICGARFLDQPVATMAAADLPDLFTLALLAGYDTLAQAVLTRRVALAATDSARDHLWLEGLDTLLHTEPVRLTMATALVAHLDALGPSALQTRVAAHERLLAFGIQRFDRPLIRQQAERLLALERPGEQPIPIKIALVTGRLAAYRALFQVAYVDHPDSLPALAQRIQQDLRQPGWTEHRDNLWKQSFTTIDHLYTASPDALLAWVSGESQSGLILNDRRPPPVTARYWFPADSTAGQNTVQPMPGHVSLVLGLDSYCFDADLWDSWGRDNCTTWIARVARWQHQYAAAGLRMTVVTDTHGHALYSGPLTPAAEAQAIAWYVQQFAHLPVPVAVQQQTITRHLAPDGTIAYDTAAFARTYRGWEPEKQALVVLTDRDGHLVYQANNEKDSAPLEALLARLFTSPSSVPPSAATTSGGPPVAGPSPLSH
jgi:hypothetical protein